MFFSTTATSRSIRRAAAGGAVRQIRVLAVRHAEDQLLAAHAFLSPAEAEQAGVALRLRG